MYNFNLVNGDTDSITIAKPNGENFTKEEQSNLLKELNNLYSDSINWEPDGYFPRFLVFKAKTYVMLDEQGKIKYKGSALRNPKLEPALQEFIKRITEAILYDKGEYTNIYNEYVKEIYNLKDINRWCTRITISAKTLESERTNETKIIDALGDSEYVEGDRRYVFFKEDDSLSLVENFNGDYNKKKLIGKLFKTGLRFATVLDTKNLFVNYALKKNQSLIELL